MGVLNTQKIAEKIADDLFESDQGEKADRLILESLKDGYLAGWSKAAVISRIKKILDQEN